MATHADVNGAEELDSVTSAYETDRRILLVQQSKVACLICVFGVPAGYIMDQFLYPDNTYWFLRIRLVCNAIMIGILILLHTSVAARFSRFFGLIWVVPMVTYPSILIALTEGVASPYYIGIAMVVIGGCLLLPWTLGECLAAGAVTLATYSAGCLFNFSELLPVHDSHWRGAAINNLFFMILFLIICAAASYYSERFRRRDFRLQHELEVSYQRLAEIDKAKNHFFANISHELRTPLTLILGPLDRLRTSISERTIPEVQETLDMMHGNAMRLLSSINDLLDLIRLEEGKMETNAESVDLATLLPGLASAVTEMAALDDIRIETRYDQDQSLVVLANRSHLEKVFLNLLFNAIKFTDTGGLIQLSAARSDDAITVNVRDNGVGIPASKLSFIFDRFWQVDGAPTRSRPGTGIGLALVKEFVELHGGTIAVTSEEGAGTTFVVTLHPDTAERKSEVPAASPTQDRIQDLYQKAEMYKCRTNAHRPGGDSTPPAVSLRHKILVVEDERDMQRFLASDLEKSYTVITADDGEAGLALAEEHRPDLILTDVMLPKLDGINLCLKLKASPKLISTKIILLTARANDHAKLEALKAGADDFMTKPFSSVELKTRLANLLLNSRLERELQLQNEALEKTLEKLKATEAQLIQQERLSALGNLSAGIMHEINNPINFMLTAVHVLKQDLPETDTETREVVADIEDGLQRIRNIIADLKSFAYSNNSETKTPCKAQKVFDTTRRLLANELDNNIQLDVDINDEDMILGSENQLVQILVNLLQNAVHATTKNSVADKPRHISLTMAPDADMFVIRVRDNGQGIEKAVIDKIFDPFFTTKEAGQGTGLGLSISHTLVQKNNGEISVNSIPEEFTEFTVRLPLVLADSAA